MGRQRRSRAGGGVVTVSHLLSSAVCAALSFGLLTPRSALPAQVVVGFETSVPTDPAVRTGVLANGMRYYVRANRAPSKRAELRLVVNAGSIVEDDDQRGMAHVIEHMAFNGTTHFQKNDLVNFMQSIGVRFGADLNAYTGFDETVFMLQVPTDTARILEQGLTVLEDWAHGQRFDSTEVANERAVVVEEWRAGQGAADRMREQYWPTLFRGSRYADRRTIGSERSILSATPSLLRRFYRDWYRPDLMAVIAVGDFDPFQMEEMIKRRFDAIPPASQPRPRVVATVPPNKEPLVAIVSDKEATSTNVQILFKLPQERTRTIGDFRRQLIGRLYVAMLNSRLNEVSQRPDAPFAQAVVGKQSLVRGLDVFSVSALAKDGGAERAAEALIVETRRIDQSGLLQAELDRAKATMLQSYQRAFADRGSTASSQLTSQYVVSFLSGDPVPSIETEYSFVRQLLPTIGLTDVNTLASSWITDENRVIVVQAPERAGVGLPTSAAMLAALDRAAKAPLTAYVENLSSDALLATLPQPGTVVATRRRSEIGVTEWTLSNGARVIVKPTDYKADEVRFSAFSDGGSSVVPDSDFMSAVMAAQVVYASGLGNLSRVDVGKKLSGKSANLVPNISPTAEGLDGLASPKDLETLLQLAYLQFTAPRLDTAAVTGVRNQFNAMLANQGASPERAAADTFTTTMGSNHFRARPFSAATFAEVDPNRAFAIYRERFADASDFTFVFVWAVDTATLRPLVERYLASLPTTHRAESWKDVGVRPPDGIVEKVVRGGVEQKSITYIAFAGSMEYSAESRFALRALTELVRIRLIETLREKMGGTYAPTIGSAATKIPVPQYQITTVFSSAPENVEPLSRAVFALVDTLQQRGPSQMDVDKVKEALLRAHEVEIKDNGYWLSELTAHDRDGEDLGGDLASYDGLVRSLSTTQIRAAANRFLNTKRYVRVVLMPEKR